MNATRITLLILASTLLAACATPASTRYYTLSSPASSQQPAALSPIAIEVLPVNVPERLKRPQLVVGTANSTQLRILEQERWSASFNDELRDALASGISSQLGALDTTRGGRLANQPLYRVAVVLRQLDATPGDSVYASFGWTITRVDKNAAAGNEAAISCQSVTSKKVAAGTDALVQAIQASVADAVTAIATNINRLNAGGAVDSGAECSR